MVQIVPDDYFPVVQSTSEEHVDQSIKPPVGSNGENSVNELRSTSLSSSLYMNWVTFDITPNETLEEAARNVSRMMGAGLLDEASRAAADAFGIHSVAVNGTLFAMGIKAMLHYLHFPLYVFLSQRHLFSENVAALTNRSVFATQYAVCRSWNTMNVVLEPNSWSSAFVSSLNPFFWIHVLAPGKTWCIYAEVLTLFLCFAILGMILLVRARYKKYHNAFQMYAVPAHTVNEVPLLFRGLRFVHVVNDVLDVESPPELSLTRNLPGMSEQFHTHSKK